MGLSLLLGILGWDTSGILLLLTTTHHGLGRRCRTSLTSLGLSDELVKIHQVLELGNACEKLLDAVEVDVGYVDMGRRVRLPSTVAGGVHRCL